MAGGLVGITLNENARNRFFLISAYLVWLTEEDKETTRDSEAARNRHYYLSQAILKMQTENAQKLVSTIEGFINPFSYQENDIINQVTNAVISEKIKQGICLIEEVGVATRETFIQERIKTEHVNIWAPMQNVQLQTYSAPLNNVHVAISNKVSELKEEGGLFAGIAANSPPTCIFRSALVIMSCL